MLATLVFLKDRKRKSHDYSQAVGVGALRGVNTATIGIPVWTLSSLSSGYATKEYETIGERLGVCRPKEHTDNHLDYFDGLGPPQVRPPHPQPRSMQARPRSTRGLEAGGWATSAGYLLSFSRSIHFCRLYKRRAPGLQGGPVRGAEVPGLDAGLGDHETDGNKAC